MSSMEPDEGTQADAPRLDRLEAADAADAPRLDTAEATGGSDAPRLDRAPRLDAAGAGSAEDDPDDSPDS
ncbi:MAG TPA: hypothetical protein VFO47_04895 [Actinomycetes bacterium]|jgi:hypothetical protein|nr:hypothetical protein [Actinomycetes bacterium]HEX5882559.1 hypothetical protein [Actinomycetota bacterium]